MKVLIVGPSGVGKTTLINSLDGMEFSGWTIRRVISTTTREPRPGEQDGVHYHFVSRERFEAERDEYVGPTEYRGNLYGMHQSHLKAEPKEVLVYATDLEGIRAAKQDDDDIVFAIGMIAEVPLLCGRLSGRKMRLEGIEAEQDQVLKFPGVDRLLYAGGTELDVLSRAVNQIAAFIENEQGHVWLIDYVDGVAQDLGI